MSKLDLILPYGACKTCGRSAMPRPESQKRLDSSVAETVGVSDEIKAAVLAEREACAQTIEASFAGQWVNNEGVGSVNIGAACASAIRYRSETEAV